MLPLDPATGLPEVLPGAGPTIVDTAAALAAQIAATPSPVQGGPSGIPTVGRQYGTVVSVQTGSLTITLGGSSVNVAGVKYMTGYVPKAGDTVVVDHVGTDTLVIGTLAGASGGGGGGGVPIGAMLPFPVAAAPAGWLLCDGSTFSAVTYPALNTLLGGTTLPDARNRLLMGAGSTVSLGATAGSTTSSALIAHTHPFTMAATGSAGRTDGTDPTGVTPGTLTTGSAGSGSSFSILNPVLGVAVYIRAL